MCYDGALLFVWLFVFVVVFFLHKAFVSCFDSSLFWPFSVRFIFEVLYRSLSLAANNDTANVRTYITTN